MTWFKVDDKLHSHRKVAALGNDIGALALWTVAGSWCADHLTDGFVPRYMVPQLLPVSRAKAFRMAFALETVGLWENFTREVDGKTEQGWLFHGWSERGRQPTSAQVLADRDANAARQAEFRERKRAERNAVSNGVSNTVGNGAPTRPDPYKEQQQRAGAHARRATGIPVGAVPLVDACTTEGLVVTWDLADEDWQTVRAAVERSGIPALVEHAKRRHFHAKTPAHSARAWVRDWSTLPALNSGAPLAPAAPSAIGAPSVAAAMQPPSFDTMRHEFARPAAAPDFGDAFGMPA